MKTLKQILEREGLDYECLTELVREWLQQELDTMPKGEYGEKTMTIKLLWKLEQ